MLASLMIVVALSAPSMTVEHLLTTHGWGEPARDADLDAAAAELARRLAGPVDGPIPDAVDAHLRFILQRNGITDAQVYPFTVRYRVSDGLQEALPGLLGRLDRRLPPTDYGIGSHGIGSAVTTTLLMVHRGVQLDAPLPRTAEVGSIGQLKGSLRRGYFKPRVLVAPPGDLPVRERPAWSKDRAVEVGLYFDAGPGIYGIEVVAESQYGPVVLNNHRIYVDVEPPTTPTVRLVPPGADIGPAARLHGAINAWREKLGRAPLRVDPHLTTIAEEHARDVAGRRSLVHTSPDTGTLITRLRARGVVFSEVAENLAEAANPEAALQAFIDSPGHKRNLMLPAMTHVGLAVVGRYYVVAMAAGRDLQ